VPQALLVHAGTAWQKAARRPSCDRRRRRRRRRKRRRRRRRRRITSNLPHTVHVPQGAPIQLERRPPGLNKA